MPTTPWDAQIKATSARTLPARNSQFQRALDFLRAKMNRIDNHRLLSVATGTARMQQIRLTGYQAVPGYNLPIFTIRPDIQIEKGTELVRIPLDNLEATGKGQVDVRLNFEFRFTQLEVPKGLGVTTTMRKIRDEVRWVLSQFE